MAKVPALAGLIGLVGAWALPSVAHAAVVEANAGLHAVLFDFHALVAPTASRSCGSGMAHLGSLAVLALLVIVALRFRHAATRQRLELARTMVAQGMEPPSELFSSERRNDLRRGLVLVAAGAGLICYGLWTHPDAPSAAGLIPGFIGIGYLLSHRFAGQGRR